MFSCTCLDRHSVDVNQAFPHGFQTPSLPAAGSGDGEWAFSGSQCTVFLFKEYPLLYLTQTPECVLFFFFLQWHVSDSA